MGKNLIQQARGKGGPRYRAPSFKYKGRARYGSTETEVVTGVIVDLVKCRGHSAPLAQVEYDNGEIVLLQAPEGVRVGAVVEVGTGIKPSTGNVMTLKDIPEGTAIFNVEAIPGDGGKFVRSSGGFAKIITKSDSGIVVQLPSSKRRSFLPNCRATIGIVAGAGRKEKPFLKAGTRHFAMKAKNKLWPQVSGTSQNAVDHPYGSGSSAVKGGPTQSSRHAPPGAKVGKVAPRRTGRKKR